MKANLIAKYLGFTLGTLVRVAIDIAYLWFGLWVLNYFGFIDFTTVCALDGCVTFMDF